MPGARAGDLMIAPTIAPKEHASRIESLQSDMMPLMKQFHIPSLHRTIELWDRHIRESPAYPRILIATAFLGTFGTVRTITHGIRGGWLPVHNLQIGPPGKRIHIHHYFWGIATTLLICYIQLGFAPKRGRNEMSVFYGIALGLILDEYALLLNLTDDYWEKQGRESIDAVAVAGSIVTISASASPFLRALIAETQRHEHEA